MHFYGKYDTIFHVGTYVHLMRTQKRKEDKSTWKTKSKYFVVKQKAVPEVTFKGGGGEEAP